MKAFEQFILVMLFIVPYVVDGTFEGGVFKSLSLINQMKMAAGDVFSVGDILYNFVARVKLKQLKVEH